MEVSTDGNAFDVRVKVLKSHVIGTGKTLAEAIADVEPAVRDFENDSAKGFDPVLMARSRRRWKMGGKTFTPKTFREKGGKP